MLQALVDRLTAEGVIEYPIEVRKFGPVGFGTVEIQLLRNGDSTDPVGKFFTSRATTRDRTKRMPEPCLAPFAKLKRKYGRDLELWVISWAFLNDPRLWGHGIGKLIYEDILRDAGTMGAVVAPHWCVPGGSTTEAAQRVWDSVKKRHESLGPIVIPKNLRV